MRNPFADWPQRSVVALWAWVMLAACAPESAPVANGAGGSAPSPSTVAIDHPHVVFSEPDLVIDRLETPIRPRVSTGSRPSPKTLRSTDASVVSITAEGALLAHRNGDATIETRAGEGSILRVRVRAITGLTLWPDHLTLLPGQSAVLQVAPTPGEAPLEAIAWSVDDPKALSVRDGVVTAGESPGTFRVKAQYGGVESSATIQVKTTGGEAIAVSPAKARLRVGEVRAFQAFSRGGPLKAQWSSEKPAVLVALGGGLFQARAAGKSRLCAAASGGEACSQVEVGP